MRSTRSRFSTQSLHSTPRDRKIILSSLTESNIRTSISVRADPPCNVLSAWWALIFSSCSHRSSRQQGHVRLWLSSHVSMQLLWNSCPQGSFRTLSPFSNWLKQIEQLVSAAPLAAVRHGSWSTSTFGVVLAGDSCSGSKWDMSPRLIATACIKDCCMCASVAS